MKVTHAQLGVLRDRTAGYAQKEFEIDAYATGQVNLTVFGVVYTVDPDGFYTARRLADGSVIYQSDPFRARARD